MKMYNLSIFKYISAILLLILSNAYSAPSFVAVGNMVSISPKTNQFTENNPVIYTTIDGGINWKANILEQLDQQKQLEAISCSNNNHYCTAVGEENGKPIIYTSNNAGENWVFHESSLAQKDHISSIFCSGDKGKNCVAAGRVNMKAATLTSTDAGLHWTPHVLGKEGEISFLMSISCGGIDNKYCMALGVYRPPFQKGEVPVAMSIGYYTFDGGTKWYETKIPNIATYNTEITSVSCNGYHGQCCTAVGAWDSNPIIYTTTNGGSSWMPNLLQTQKDWSTPMSSVSCTGEYGQYCTAIATSRKPSGISKIISYTTQDGGVTWSQHPVNQSDDPNLAVHAADLTCYGEFGEHCLIIGYLSDIASNTHSLVSFTSDNGGINWTMHNNNIEGLKDKMGMGNLSHSNGEF